MDLRKKEIVSFLDDCQKPVGTDVIRKATSIGNWNTVLKHCLELVIHKEITGIETGNGWVFEKEGGEKNE